MTPDEHLTEQSRVQTVFWGCGRQAIVLRDILSHVGATLTHVVSDAGETEFEGIPVSEWNRFLKSVEREKPTLEGFVIAIGGANGTPRLDRFHRMRNLGLRPLTLVHPTATLLSEVSIGEACQVLARSVLGVRVRLGNAVIVNTGAIVDHETVVGDGCHVAPGSVLLGRVSLGERVFIGANATVLPDLSICSDVIVGAGSVVVCDISQPGTYVGAPARRVSTL